VSLGQLTAYPSFRRFENRGFDYSPDEFGFPLEEDFKGDYRASQGALFISYGLSADLSVGVRATVANARFRKASSDHSGLAGETTESGLEELSAEVAWRFSGNDGGPTELFLLTQILAPHDGDKLFLGQDGVMILPRLALIRTLSWGLLDGRLGLEYDSGSETPFDVGRWSLHALGGLTGSLDLGGGFEGQIGGANNFDEVWLTTYLQWSARPNLMLRVSSDFGVTALTRGWSPQIAAGVRL
jgi:hypothetical protein